MKLLAPGTVLAQPWSLCIWKISLCLYVCFSVFQINRQSFENNADSYRHNFKFTLAQFRTVRNQTSKQQAHQKYCYQLPTFGNSERKAYFTFSKLLIVDVIFWLAKYYKILCKIIIKIFYHFVLVCYLLVRKFGKQSASGDKIKNNSYNN